MDSVPQSNRTLDEDVLAYLRLGARVELHLDGMKDAAKNIGAHHHRDVARAADRLVSSGKCHIVGRDLVLSRESE